MLLMIDNYDSFTYNLVQYFRELEIDVKVIKNDQYTVDQIVAMAPSFLVISPGPCTPNEAGISSALIAKLQGRIPVLGVCLGHQCIARSFGADVVRANKVMHGKTSHIYHRGEGIFRDLPSPFVAIRYHSLVVDKASFSRPLSITAWTQNKNGDVDEIMALQHKHMPVFGVQFHPESIMSEHGHRLLKNFLSSKINR